MAMRKALLGTWTVRTMNWCRLQTQNMVIVTFRKDVLCGYTHWSVCNMLRPDLLVMLKIKWFSMSSLDQGLQLRQFCFYPNQLFDLEVYVCLPTNWSLLPWHISDGISLGIHRKLHWCQFLTSVEPRGHSNKWTHKCNIFVSVCCFLQTWFYHN